jgi:hypothetical protein
MTTINVGKKLTKMKRILKFNDYRSGGGKKGRKSKVAQKINN